MRKDTGIIVTRTDFAKSAFCCKVQQRIMPAVSALPGSFMSEADLREAARKPEHSRAWAYSAQRMSWTKRLSQQPAECGKYLKTGSVSDDED